MKHIPIAHILSGQHTEQSVTVCGLVRTCRQSKHITFIAINDGSCFESLQIISELPADQTADISTGTALRCHGHVVPSPGTGQQWELQAQSIEITGEAPESYPLQKKRHSLEFLRGLPHLRPRSNTFNAVFRLRSSLSHAIHRYFADLGFHWVQTPIITANDCEGAGEQFRVTTLPAGDTHMEQDFFGRPASLTVSGQLEGEAFATALGRIYTFGPTFRSENSNTSRHLAEFWMVEPEVAFADLDDIMALAEDFVQSMVGHVCDTFAAEVAFFEQHMEKGLLQKLQQTTAGSFARITYTQAIEILLEAPRSFTFPVAWGVDLQSEHERYLCEEHFQKPVFVTDYPKQIKAFYMKLNDDGTTVRAMDLLLPGIGEIIGGSQREDDIHVLQQRMEEIGLDMESMDWYLELRRYGNQPHAGFGLGLERLLQYVTGVHNIRDVIPFPRAPKLI